MRRPTVSIAGLMAVVALAAVDCVALRSPPWRQPMAVILLQLGGVPMANALAVGLLLIARGRMRGEGPRPFLVGFEVVGWAALLLYLAVPTLAPASTVEYLRWTLAPALRAVRLAGFGGSVGASIALVLWVAFLTAHPLIPALMGGWAARTVRAVGPGNDLPAAHRDLWAIL